MTAHTNGTAPPREGWQIRLRDYRCRGCARLLFRGYVIKGTIVEVKCGRCARVNQVEGSEVKRDEIVPFDKDDINRVT